MFYLINRPPPLPLVIYVLTKLWTSVVSLRSTVVSRMRTRRLRSPKNSNIFTKKIPPLISSWGFLRSHQSKLVCLPVKNGSDNRKIVVCHNAPLGEHIPRSCYPPLGPESRWEDETSWKRNKRTHHVLDEVTFFYTTTTLSMTIHL